jgi:hypothetical protein
MRPLRNIYHVTYRYMTNIKYEIAKEYTEISYMKTWTYDRVKGTAIYIEMNVNEQFNMPKRSCWPPFSLNQ